MHCISNIQFYFQRKIKILRGSMMQTSDFHISRILSYALHPLLIPTLATSALLLRPDLYSIVLPHALRIWFISLVIVFTLVIPVTGVFILLKFNALNSMEMNRTHHSIDYCGYFFYGIVVFVEIGRNTVHLPLRNLFGYFCPAGRAHN